VKKAVLLMVATLLATFGALAAVTAPANAAYSSCPAGVSCLFAGENGVGTMGQVAFSTYHDGKCHNVMVWPTGGYHSAIGGYGSGYSLVVYNGSDCGSGYLATLYNGYTESSAFEPVWSFIIE
jgi:hypothetical protein